MAREPDPYLELLKKCLCASLYDESAWRIPEGTVPLSWRRPLRLLGALLLRPVLRALSRRSLMLVKRVPFDPERREQGRDWPCFGYTMAGQRRLDQLQRCIEQVLEDAIPGDLIETGVWRGGCAMLMRAVLKQHGVTDRVVWAADSFEGLPRPDVDAYAADRGEQYDLSQVGHLKVSLAQVQANFARFGLLDDRVRFLKGWFRDTLPGAPIAQLAVLRLDGDLYESTMDALQALYHRVSAGGFVIVDDYGAWEPCRKAVDDFRRERGIEAPLHEIDWTGVYWRAPRPS